MGGMGNALLRGVADRKLAREPHAAKTQQLSWKCQLASGTTREHVRVARALGTFPRRRPPSGCTATTRTTASTGTRTNHRGGSPGPRSRTTSAPRPSPQTSQGPEPAQADEPDAAGEPNATGEPCDGFRGNARVPASPGTGPADMAPRLPGRCHLDDGPAISPATLQLIGCNATISTMIHDTGYRNLVSLCKRHQCAGPRQEHPHRRRQGRVRVLHPAGITHPGQPAAARAQRRHHPMPWCRHHALHHHPAALRRTTRPPPRHLDLLHQRPHPSQTPARPANPGTVRLTNHHPA
jgi:hypothetical protein